MDENGVAKVVVDVAYRMHTVLGPGLFESVYEMVMVGELEKRGLHVVGQQSIPLIYEGTNYPVAFRADMVVESKVIIEIKSITEVTDIHKK